MSIIDFQARRRSTPPDRRQALYDLDDTFAIAEILIDDTADLVHKAVGGFLREAGKHDVSRLTALLDRHAATMNRTALRYAIKHIDSDARQHYLSHRVASPTDQH